MSSEVGASHIYTDFQGLADLHKGARQNSPETLRVVAKQFEAYLVQQLLRSGRDASLGNGILDNKGSAFYQDLFDKQVALSVTEGTGLGIADMLVKQVEGAQHGVSVSSQKADDSAVKSTGTEWGRQVVPPTTRGKATQPPVPSVERTLAASVPVANSASEVTGGTRLRFDTAQEFVSAVMPHARRVGAELGVDPGLLVSQAALETGWGKSIIRNGDGTSSHNLFNIKAHGGWDGPVAAARTMEYVNGAKVKIRDGFRSYESFAHSFRDYVDFLHANPRYGDALQQTADPAAFAHALQKAGYATDPKYADKILSIYRRVDSVASTS